MFYTDQETSGTSRNTLQDFEPSFGTKMQATINEAWQESYGPVVYDWLAARKDDGSPKLSAADAKAKIEASGLRVKISPKDGEYTDGQLSVILERQRELTVAKDVRERTPWDWGSPVRGAAMFGAGIVDPINLATAFVPWTKTISAARGLQAATQSASWLTRAWGRAGLGAIDGGISTLALEPFYAGMRRDLGDDYTALDSVANIAFGAAFGGGIHAIGGAGVDMFRRATGRSNTPLPDPITVAEPPRGMVAGADLRVRIGENYEPAQWAVVDADQLTATVDKADNQFRDRTRAAYQAEIQARANALDPAQVLSLDSPLMDVGTPTVSVDGKIIGGNGRTLFLQRAYEIGKADEYRAALEKRLIDIGIDPATISDMKRPVLVRRLTRAVDVKKAAMLSNEGGSSAMSPLEQAKVDAERLGDARLEADADGGLDTAGNRAAIRKWVEQQPEGQRNALITEDGRLSAAGLQRLRNAVLHKAYGDSPTLARLIEATDVGSRNVAAALARSVGRVADAEQAIKAGQLHPLSISEDIRLAVEQFDNLRRQGAKVSDYLAQMDMLGSPLTDEARLLLDAMGRNIQSSRRIADIITGYYDRLVEAGNPGQGDMFGGVVPDKLRMLDDAIRAAESTGETAAETVAGLSPETREATLRAAVAQSVQGREIDVDAIVRTETDATARDVMDAAARNQRPEAIRVADFDAADAVQQRVDTAPKWDGVKDAEAALAEADMLLADTVKAGDQAFRYSRGAENPNILYSRGLDGQSAADFLTESVRNSFGASTDALLNTGRIKIVGTPKDIPGGPHPGDVKGATAPDGTVYIVAENVAEAEARGMVLHEVGVHVGMEQMLGPDVFQSVLRELDDAILRGEEWAQAARDRVPADTAAGLVREEQLAYLVQNAPELGIVKRIIAAVRAWAYRTFEFARDRMELSEADFRALAVSALHAAARGEQGGVLAGAYARAKKVFTERELQDMDIDELDRMAWGVNIGDIIDVSPADLNVQYHGDLENPEYRFQKEGMKWVRSVDLSEPIQVSILDDGKMYIDDGHHRYFAAKMLGKKLKAEIDIKANSVVKVMNDQAASTKYSRGSTPDPSTAADELKPYNDAITRAKSYASVLRAAADKLDNDAEATAAMRAAMPDITATEIKDLLDQLRTSVKGLRGMARSAREAITSEDTAGILQSDAMHAADTLANNLVMAKVIEKRNAALNMNARLKSSSFVNQFKAKGLDFEGFAALLVGSERVRTGSRISVDGEYKGFRGEWVGGMIADVEKLNLMREFVSGEFDRDIYDALWRMGQKTPDMSGLPPEAVKLAEVVNKYQTDARNTRNRFGAWIRDLQGYITRQSHDMFKIREVSDAEWSQFALQRLDIPKMQKLGLISETDPMASLRRMYDDFAAGVHMKSVAGEEDTVAFGTGSNLAKRESVSRALYFKDGVAAFEYNERFGTGRLAESVLAGLDHSARSAALMKSLGTNPEASLNRLMDEYENSLVGDPDRRAKFRADRGKIENLLKHVDGTANIPGNVTAAKIGSFLRAWQSMAKLGGALLSSVTDLTGYAAELRYTQDKNLLSGVLEGIGALTQGRPKGEKQQILASLGMFHDSVVGGIAARFDSPDLVGGKMAAAMQQFFKLNGLAFWTETLRDGAALAHSHYLAINAGKQFDALPSDLQRLLSLYNIDAGKWGILRMAQTAEADGRKFLTPDGLATVPRAAFENYIQQAGRTVNDATVQNLKDDLSQALRVMTVDRAHHAVLEPSARTRAWMLRGTQPGTVPGEILRYIGQFKSFSVAMTQMVLGREIYGRGYDTLGEYLKKGHGDMVGLATYLGMTMAMGYAAMSAKDLLKGKTPRPVDDYKTWMAAMAQGGGLGLYGDFLFGEYSRMGRSFTASLAGPVIGNLDTITDLWTRLRKGDDTAAVAFNSLLQNTPFMNLFWVRPILDYLILYQMQESLNPGFLRRMERRIERENGQSYLLPPSQYAR